MLWINPSQDINRVLDIPRSCTIGWIPASSRALDQLTFHQDSKPFPEDKARNQLVLWVLRGDKCRTDTDSKHHSL